jgi:hypothetical protein
MRALEPRAEAAISLGGSTRHWSAWLAARFPIVWRTRLALFLPASICATALAAWIALASPVTPYSIATLRAELFDAAFLSFLTYGAVLLFALDAARRATPLFGTSALLRVFVGVMATTAAIQLPRQVYFAVNVGRTAAVQTPEEVQSLIARHARHGFWRCAPAPFEVPPALQADLAKDLAAYGLRTTFEVVPDDRRGCDDRIADSAYGDHPMRSWWSLHAWDSLSPQRRSNAVLSFEGRIRNVEAAQQYLQGAGPFASLLAWQRVIAAAGCAALLTTLFVATSRHRWKAVTWWRQLGRVSEWRLTSRLDEYLAAHWPTVWASRVHRSLTSIVAAALALMSLLAPFGLDSLLFALLVAVGVVTLLASQARAASARAGVRQDVGVLLIHTGLFAILGAVAQSLFAPDAVAKVWRVAVVVAMVASGWIQAARVGSVYTASGAIVTTFVSVLVFSLAALVSLAFTMVAGAVLTVTLGTLAWWASVSPVARTLQRLIVGCLHIQLSYFWVATLTGLSDEIQSVAMSMLILGLYVSCTVAVLYVSQESRRVLTAA